MTNQNDDDRLDRYLWDPDAEPDESVRDLEQRLAALRFDPDRTPLILPSPRPLVRTHRRPAIKRWWPRLAAAAMLLLAITSLLAVWRWTWPAGRAWSVSADPGIAAPRRLAVGHTLRIPARLEVARIGTLRLSGDSLLTLRATRSNHHRLTLARGSVHVRVWAPPFSVVIQTPAGNVGDVGCEFDLQADPEASRVSVRTGWVQLENDLGEMLVPAGATGLMLTGRPPSVPVYEDARPGFLNAVRALEEGRADAEAAIDQIVKLARRRDVLTLLMLVRRSAEGRERLVSRAAVLYPPPEDDTVRRILDGESAALWQWYDTLPLPPVKRWWWNWRDALPRWMGADRR
jgi:hypothetical protein